VADGSLWLGCEHEALCLLRRSKFPHSSKEGLSGPPFQTATFANKLLPKFALVGSISKKLRPEFGDSGLEFFCFS
jgi:hypothetical protein